MSAAAIQLDDQKIKRRHQVDYTPENYIHPVEDADDPAWMLSPVPAPEGASGAPLPPLPKSVGQPTDALDDDVPHFSVKPPSTRDPGPVTFSAAGKADQAQPAGVSRPETANAAPLPPLSFTGHPLSADDDEAGSVLLPSRSQVPAVPAPVVTPPPVAAVPQVEPIPVPAGLVLEDPWDLVSQVFRDEKPEGVSLQLDAASKPFFRAGSGDELHIVGEMGLDQAGKPVLAGYSLVQRCWWGERVVIWTARGETASAGVIARSFFSSHAHSLPAAVGLWLGPKLAAAGKSVDADFLLATRFELLKASELWRNRISEQLGPDGWPEEASQMFDEAVETVTDWLAGAVARHFPA